MAAFAPAGRRVAAPAATPSSSARPVSARRPARCPPVAALSTKLPTSHAEASQAALAQLRAASENGVSREFWGTGTGTGAGAVLGVAAGGGGRG